MFGKNHTIVKTYQGKQDKATSLFQADTSKMAAQGYYPTSQSYQAGQWGLGSFFIGLLLCLVFVGFLIFLYMLLVKPAGMLTVTYELRSVHADSESEVAAMKTCPMCAENVKAAARICRYCSHEFS